MDEKAILKKLDGIEGLPTLPAIALEINAMLQGYETAVNDLARIIEKDQAIVPKILRLVNSAFFGFQSKIKSLPRAIIILGFNTIRNAVISVSIIDALSMKETLKGFDISDFWTHSISVAIISRHLAKLRCKMLIEDAFTAGLLHDIGKIIMAQYFPEFFEKVWISAKRNGLTFYEAEKKELPITHSGLGEYLANKWQLPEDLVGVIKYHHRPDNSNLHPDLLMIVHTADVIVNQFIADLSDQFDMTAINTDAKKMLKDEIKTLPDWYSDVSEEISSACRFFFEG